MSLKTYCKFECEFEYWYLESGAEAELKNLFVSRFAESLVNGLRPEKQKKANVT